MQQFQDLVQLFDLDGIQPFHQFLNLLFSGDVRAVITVGLRTVALTLPVLRHHDDRRCIGCLRGKQQVEQNIRLWVPVVDQRNHIQAHPCRYNERLPDNKPPGAHAARYFVGEPLAKSGGFFVAVVPGLDFIFHRFAFQFHQQY